MAAIMDEENQPAVGGIIAYQDPTAYKSTEYDESSYMGQDAARVIQGVHDYNSKKKNVNFDEHLDYHATISGMRRSTIKLREPFTSSLNVFNMDSYLKRMLETTEEERAEADDVFKRAFPDSYPYVNPTDKACQQLFHDSNFQ
uniref:Uncharacterized protein n=1 Tax=Pseudo-nitzschia australis TaxID=44445 RepID=A0A7S4EMG7_9STRA